MTFSETNTYHNVNKKSKIYQSSTYFQETQLYFPKWKTLMNIALQVFWVLLHVQVTSKSDWKPRASPQVDNLFFFQKSQQFASQGHTDRIGWKLIHLPQFYALRWSQDTESAHLLSHRTYNLKTSAIDSEVNSLCSKIKTSTALLGVATANWSYAKICYSIFKSFFKWTQERLSQKLHCLPFRFSCG